MSTPRRMDEILMMQAALALDDERMGLWTAMVAVGSMHDNRFHYLLDKWTRKDWWDYGVSMRTGWLTDEGRRALGEITGASQ